MIVGSRYTNIHHKLIRHGGFDSCLCLSIDLHLKQQGSISNSIDRNKNTSNYCKWYNQDVLDNQ